MRARLSAGSSAAAHPTSNSTDPYARDTANEMYAGVIASDAHTVWRRSLTLAAAHPELNLRKPAYEEGENRGPLHDRAQQE